jgi:regulation of enolase protein 1 (concanavalin A-like superfamily)
MKTQPTHNQKYNLPKKTYQKKGFFSDPVILFLLFLLVAFNGVYTKAVAQTNPANPFKAPLYWNPYEYCYTKDGSIPEDIWSQNIDWVDANLKSYGYNMICIDGWGDIKANITYNENGYLTSHSDKWTHDFAWWSANLQARGMTLGMYQNPLWVYKNAANAGALIKGTSIPLSNIIDTSENGAFGFTWVQVNNDGAEEYVKGYIQHFADMGIKYLRVDFLSWFESGYDRNIGRVGPSRPKADYEKALRWMREACDANEMLLSLVMPNLANEAELEQKYGHMIRINDDCATGEWERFNNFDRGARRNEWSQWGSTMDGLAYWSYISGRNKITLDGDFIRLNTFVNDDERKTAISANLLAGGPVTPADQYNTIGTNLWLYQNTEMLALNQDKFVGKPVSNDPTNVNSQIWKGQISNGDWIVGLFNRENTAETRSVNFATDLGLTASSDARDLWEHTDLGTMTAFSASIPAHGCIILRITPTASNKVVSPVLSLAGGTYTSTQSVVLSSTTTGAVIRYTTDGSTPNSSSTVYTGSISVTESKTIKAYATKSGMTDSNTSQAIYRINLPPPSPWLHGDIGSVNSGGTAGYSGGSFNNSGAGADIEGTTDAFHYIYQAVSGDVTITARVESLTNTDPWAKAGVMIRSTTAADAINTMTAVTSKNGILFQKRTANSGTTSSNYAANVSSPVWVRLQKTGNVISSWKSKDGLLWDQIGTAATVTLPTTFYVGLAVTSHNNSTLSTATYSDVSIDTGGSVAAPTFSPGSGTYTSAQSVTLSSATAGAVIRYTTNGSTPTNISPIYNGPINIDASTTITAYASKSGMTDSSVEYLHDTINLPIVSTPILSPATYTSSQSVTLSSTTEGAVIRYTIDGTTPNSTSTVYSGAINLSAPTTIKAFASKSGMENSSIASVRYTLDVPVVAEPTFSSAAGAYTSEQFVTLSSATVGATIRYTTNGSTPDSTSTVYSSPINVAESKTIRTYATKSGMADSSLAQATYTLTLPPPAPWLHGDIGSVNTTGTAVYTNTYFNNTGAGADIESTADGFHYIYQPVSGDVTITARVESLDNTNPWAKAGVMIRSTTDADAINIMTAITPSAAILQKRTTTGGSTSSTVAGYSTWLRLQKVGDNISSFRSTNGVTWTQIGTTATLTLPSTFYVGLATTSHNNDTLTTARYSNVSVVRTVDPVTFSPTGGTYTSVQSVTLSTATEDATIRYTTDGITPNSSSTVYSAAIELSSTTTIKAFASKSGMENSAVGTILYTINLPVVAEPIFSPAAGTYTSLQTVTISTATEGATIRYTTDGSTPNSSSAVYSGSINVNESKTIKAYATKSGMTDSNIAQAIYTLNLPPPSPWLHGDIGSVSPVGNALYSNGLFSNTGAGADIEGTTDAFHYIYQPVSGDVIITARAESLTNTDPWAKAGVMIRSTTDADAVNIMTAATPSSGVTFQKRTTNAGSTSSTVVTGVSSPVWVRLQKIGDNISSFRSADGISWTQIGTTATVTLPSSFYIGLAATSHSNGTLATATYSNVSVVCTVATPTFSLAEGTYTSAQTVTISTATEGATIRYTTDGSTPNSSSAVYSGSINVNESKTIKAYATKSEMTDSNIAQAVYTLNLPPPSPWLHGDIGSVNITGNALYSNGSFINTGAGADIEGTADAFHYIYQPVSEDVIITARVESLTNTDPWAKAGVMIRSTLDANSKNVFTGITPSYGITFQNRASNGGSTTATNVVSGLTAPYWVRLKREGDVVSSYRSADGVTWTQTGTNLTTSLGTNIYIGLAVSSHTTSFLASGEFKNVTVITSGGTANYKLAPNSSKQVVQQDEKIAVSIYPNPAKVSVNIGLEKFKDIAVEIQLSNITGKILNEVKVIGGGVYEITTSALNTGIYLITLKGDGFNIVKKLLIK